jgi:hypothetical protein
MFVLGHTGIPAGAVRAIDRDVDLRAVALVALLPDLIDKPLWLFVPAFANGWSRTAGHSLTAFVLFTLLVSVRLRARAWPFVFAYASHLVLDRIWLDGHITWPFDGYFFFPKYMYDHTEQWWAKLSDLWTMGGEAIGALIIVTLAVRGRLWDRERWLAFRSRGRIA